MDITLHRLNRIIKLLEKIEENTRPDPQPAYVGNGAIDWHYPDGGFIGTLPDSPDSTVKLDD